MIKDRPKILTEGFFSDKKFNERPTIKESNPRTYKFNFWVRYPGGFQNEVIDTYEASDEGGAFEYFSDKYPSGSGSVIIDQNDWDIYCNDHPEYCECDSYNEYFTEAIKRRKLKEDYSSTIPEWAKKAITGYHGNKRNSRLSNIAWDKAQFIPEEVPTSNRDKRLKDPDRLNLFLFKNGNSDAYYNGSPLKDVTVGKFPRKDSYGTWMDYMNFSEVPWKRIIDQTDEFGYIDLTDPKNLNKDVRNQRYLNSRGSDLDPDSPIYRGKGQYKNYAKEYQSSYWDEEGKYHPGEYKTLDTYKWIVSRGEDKSGYKLDPDRLVKKLAKLNSITADNYADRLEDLYNKLEETRVKIVDKFNLDNMLKSSSWSGSDIRQVVDEFDRAVAQYKDIKTRIEDALADYYDSLDNDILNRRLQGVGQTDLLRKIKAINNSLRNL